jgi:hypothetical protein
MPNLETVTILSGCCGPQRLLSHSSALFSRRRQRRPRPVPRQPVSPSLQIVGLMNHIMAEHFGVNASRSSIEE